MKVTVDCSESRCFAQRNGKCQVLEGNPRHPCPFFQTEEQVKAGREKTKQRLRRLEREDLLQAYTNNAKGYAI